MSRYRKRWRMEARYNMTPPEGGSRALTGFVTLYALDEAAILDALRTTYPKLRNEGIKISLTYVEARLESVWVCDHERSDGNRDDPSHAYCGLAAGHAGDHGEWQT
jgi:ribonuclease I